MQIESATPNLHSYSAEQIRTHEVFKFGGSSLKDPIAVNKAVQLIADARIDLTVVVSANGDNTDTLINLYELPSNQQLPALRALIDNQSTLAKDCFYAMTQTLASTNNLLAPSLKSQPDELAVYKAQLEKDNESIKLWLKQEDRFAAKNEIVAYGECWSARLIAALLRYQSVSASAIDSRDFLRFNQNGFCKSTSFAKLQQTLHSPHLAQENQLHIVTGFIARDFQNRTLLLGRNGSDYSASIIASLIGAKKVTFWTDVNGVYSADPNQVDGARHLKSLSFHNALTLSQLGSPVLHHRTLAPLERDQIDLTIKKPSLGLEADGTDIFVDEEDQQDEQWIVNVKHKLSLVRIDEVPFTLPILLHFETDQFNNTNQAVGVIDLQQSIADNDTVIKAKLDEVSLISLIGVNGTANEQAFSQFFEDSHIQPVQLLTMPNALIALLSTSSFGSSSVVTLQDVEAQLHQYICSQQARLTIGLIGPGQVGSDVLSIINNLQTRHQRTQSVGLPASRPTLNVVLLSDSRQWREINADGTPKTTHPYDLKAFSKRLTQLAHDESVVIDTTGASSVADYYKQFLLDGHHVITANKIAGASLFDNYQKIKQSASDNNLQWFYEATVGAGLPVVKSIRELTQLGDTIERIDCVCSGSLAAIFSQYSAGVEFADAVLSAKSKGYTEPDPRLDLSGIDVARKLVILAREAGWQLELASITLPNWLPDAVLSTEAFDIDAHRTALNTHIDSIAGSLRGKPLLPLATIELRDGVTTARIRLISAETDSAFYNLSASDNLFQITSSFYNELPLIIRGPGAGSKVTAAGVVGDLLSL